MLFVEMKNKIMLVVYYFLGLGIFGMWFLWLNSLVFRFSRGNFFIR